MSDIHAQAREYLSPKSNVAWRWSADGEVVEWIAGRTIVFRKELQRILQALAPHGLPSIDGLLFLITACKEQWRSQPGELGNAAYIFCFPPLRIRDRSLELAVALDEISQLPSKHRDATEARILLARLASELCGIRTSKAVADEVCNLLDGSSTELFQLRTPVDFDRPTEFEFEWLVDGLAQIDLDELETIKRTGLDRIPAPAEAEEDIYSIRSLIQELESDEELAGLARLAKYLMGGISLPRSLSEKDDIPVGGVSDIANRGSLDRLLLSELANDDDVLMTRVALNEALYLRRESPPKSPPATRRIVIDCGVRMWGVPRVLGTAVALALAATADKNTATELYRAVDTQLVKFSLKNRADVISHLEQLRPEAHPGVAITRLDTLEVGETDTTTILITTPEVIQDREFTDQLAQVDVPLHVATVSSDGHFQLTQRTSRSWKTLAELHLDVQEILGSNKKGKSLPIVAETRKDDLPAIFSVAPFPFRLSHRFFFDRTWDAYPTTKADPADPEWVRWASDPGCAATDDMLTPTFSILSDGRLMHWDVAQRGARQLSDKLPPGRIVWKRCSQDGWSRAVIHNSPHLYLIRCHVSRLDEVAVTCLTCDLPRKIDNVCEHGGKLFVVVRRTVLVYDINEGDFVQTLKLPNSMRRRDQFDRFYVADRQVHALSYTGDRATLELVADGVSATGAFDCSFEDSPVILTYGGGLILPDGNTIMSLSNLKTVPPPVWLKDVSADGNFVVVERNPHNTGRYEARSRAILNIPLRCEFTKYSYQYYGTLAIKHPMTASSIRLKYQSFGRLGSGSLGIGIPGDRCLELSPDEMLVGFASRVITHERNLTFQSGSCFVPATSESSSNFIKRRFVSDDGSQIQVDSRGLLHFKSSLSSVPEFTLLISDDDRIAFWCSDGLCNGPPYFMQEKVDTSDKACIAALAKFVVHLKAFIRQLR
jgi:hypothetical protein